MYFIIRKDKVFTHIGIYINSSQIYHYSSKTNNFFANDKIVKCDDLFHFSRNRSVKFISFNSALNDEDIIKSSKNFAGEGKQYHIIKNNCYTFVLWCLYKKSTTCIKDILIFTYANKIPILSFVL